MDYTTLYKGFKFLEDFMNVDSNSGMSWSQVEAFQSGGALHSSMSSSNLNATLSTYQEIASSMQATADAHVIINCFICSIYFIFILFFVTRVYRISNFD